MGEEGRHARFRLGSGAGTLRARGVAFNANGTLEAAQRQPHDLAVRLEVNHWNGAVEPRAVLAGSTRDGTVAERSHDCVARSGRRDWWWERFEAELARDSRRRGGAGQDAGRRTQVVDAPPRLGRRADRRADSPAAPG